MASNWMAMAESPSAIENSCAAHQAPNHHPTTHSKGACQSSCHQHQQCQQTCQPQPHQRIRQCISPPKTSQQGNLPQLPHHQPPNHNHHPSRVAQCRHQHPQPLCNSSAHMPQWLAPQHHPASKTNQPQKACRCPQPRTPPPPTRSKTKQPGEKALHTIWTSTLTLSPPVRGLGGR